VLPSVNVEVHEDIRGQKNFEISWS